MSKDLFEMGGEMKDRMEADEIRAGMGKHLKKILRKMCKVVVFYGNDRRLME